MALHAGEIKRNSIHLSRIPCQNHSHHDREEKFYEDFQKISSCGSSRKTKSQRFSC
jgi:hypothetical protein